MLRIRTKINTERFLIGKSEERRVKKFKIILMKEQKDVRQSVSKKVSFVQSAEISASYLDEDILIIDNVKVLQNPDPMRFQMNMIASCQRGSLRAELNGREFTVEKGDIFISPP